VPQPIKSITDRVYRMKPAKSLPAEKQPAKRTAS
jgi:hypothetical protein